MTRRALLAIVLMQASAGCGDPVTDARLAALPDEVSGVPEGPHHRPGQPCVLCHSSYGGAKPFSVGGTIFAIPAQDKNDEPLPVEGATITLTDATGNSVARKTNCTGNFFVLEDEFVPQFPMRAVVEYLLPGEEMSKRKVMGTRINREGSCAGCHVGAASESSPGWVWVVDAGESPFPKPDASCPGEKNFR